MVAMGHGSVPLGDSAPTDFAFCEVFTFTGAVVSRLDTFHIWLGEAQGDGGLRAPLRGNRRADRTAHGLHRRRRSDGSGTDMPGLECVAAVAPRRRRPPLGRRDRRDPRGAAAAGCGAARPVRLRRRGSDAAGRRADRGRRRGWRPPCGSRAGCADVVPGCRWRRGVLRAPVCPRDRDPPRRRRSGLGNRFRHRRRRRRGRHRGVARTRLSALPFRGSPADARAAGSGPHHRSARHRHRRRLAARSDRRRDHLAPIRRNWPPRTSARR